MGKSAWVLTMAYIYYDDLRRHHPGVVVVAIGTRRDCLRALRKSVKEGMSALWDGVVGKEVQACLVKDIIASEKDYYGSNIKAWTAHFENMTVVWRLQRKKAEPKKETKKRRTKC